MNFSYLLVVAIIARWRVFGNLVLMCLVVAAVVWPVSLSEMRGLRGVNAAKRE